MTVLVLVTDVRPVAALRLTDPVFDADARRSMWAAVDELAAAAARASGEVAYLTARVAGIGAVA